MRTGTCEKLHETKRGQILGQFFTKESAVEKLLDILFEFKHCEKNIAVLEPSFGTGSFITVLKRRGFRHIVGCEIDPGLTENPRDFFDLPLAERFDLIIGNPPFTKYNVNESYHFIEESCGTLFNPAAYLPTLILRKRKERIENVFLLKSLKHLKTQDSSIAFILPISFFIGNRNKAVKDEILKHFSTIIIYQNDQIWFDYNIPCCFGVFCNISNLKDKIVLIYENKSRHEHIIDIDAIHQELIPQIFYNKKHIIKFDASGTPLREFLNPARVVYRKSYTENSVSAKNILQRTRIPAHSHVEDYKLAIVRVGNASVGRAGLVDVTREVLNDMFYVFDFTMKYARDKKAKETICVLLNQHQDYFKSITCRVGSKSIKKEDILSFHVSAPSLG
jgi:hypothetical protein